MPTPIFMMFSSKHKLLDLHLNLTSLTPPPESYRRGKKKIDFILGSLAISQAVVRGGGIMDYNNGLKYSDHRALFIDMDEGRLFSAKGQDLITQTGRGLHSKNKLHVKNYLTLVH